MMSLMIPRRYRGSAHPALRDVGFDRLFDDLWRGSELAPVAGGSEAGFAPRLNVRETDEAVVVTAELPGVEEKDFDVTLEDDVLTLKGEKRSEHEEEREGYRHVETHTGSFMRKVLLPPGIDADAVKASYKNGVVTVTLPKPAEAQAEARAIPVTTR